MGLTWKEAEVAALNRQEWCRSVAEYVYVDVGWIKSSQVYVCISVLICLQGDHMQVSNSDEEDDEEAEDEFHYEMELGDQQ